MKKLFFIPIAILITTSIFAMASKSEEEATKPAPEVVRTLNNPPVRNRREQNDNIDRPQRDPQVNGERPQRDPQMLAPTANNERPQREQQADGERKGDRSQRMRESQNPELKRPEQNPQRIPNEEVISHRKAIMDAIEVYKKEPTAENKAIIIEKLEERYDKEVEMQKARVETLKAEVAKLEEKVKEIDENKEKFIEDQFTKIIEGRAPKSHENRNNRKN